MSRRALAALLALTVLAGCAARPAPKDVTFVGGSSPGGTGIIVTVDMVFTAGSGSTIKYPQEYVTVSPFTHHHLAEVGTVIHMSITVHATEPGQKVTCTILLNALPVDTGAATYPKAAVCVGPPI